MQTRIINFVHDPMLDCGILSYLPVGLSAEISSLAVARVEEIRLRFVAASLFDSQGYTLSRADYEALDTVIADLETEGFGEVPFDILKENFGVGKNAVKQTALYEQKYIAFYKQLFSSPSAIYSVDYRDALKTFYETYYYRFNMIYLPDSVGVETVAALENALWKTGNVGVSAVTGVTEEEFTALEKEYTDENFKVTSGNYPNGIYLYAGESYAKSFNEEILLGFGQADTVGKVVKVRNADNSGSYYVMRYALDEAPYLLDEKWVETSFASLPNYAGIYLYRTLLRAELEKIQEYGVHENYNLPGVVSCKDYNIVQLLGNN